MSLITDLFSSTVCEKFLEVMKSICIMYIGRFYTVTCTGPMLKLCSVKGQNVVQHF